MSIIFRPENHEYISLDPAEHIDWISVTSFIGNFKSPFDAKGQAAKSARNKKSKWYGLTQEEILQAWSNESKRATDLGTWYHDQREQDICEFEHMEREGITVPVFKPVYENGVKYAPEQKLENGIYPEHLVYLKSMGLIGQSDLVEVIDGKVNITDYKTNKEIKEKGYTSWDGVVSKMQAPVNHLDDCNLNHYTLQLSIYMYMILKHNPKLKAGKLILHHILFEEVGRDKFDNPIAARDVNGDPIVKEIVQYEIPYLKHEVISLMNWLKENRHKIKSKKKEAVC
jgi:ATP-dependent exoDNAse (exonuclease V) beta subunit